MPTNFNGQMVGFMLKERLGWDRPDVFPSSVELEHDCDSDNPYVVGGNVFYDRRKVRYVPERTCRVDIHAEERGGRYVWVHTFSCGHEFESYWHMNPRYCPFCGAKVER